MTENIEELEFFLRMKHPYHSCSELFGSKTWIIWDHKSVPIFFKSTNEKLIDSVRGTWLANVDIQFKEYKKNEFYYLVRIDHV
jgi:hypothetical protein